MNRDQKGIIVFFHISYQNYQQSQKKLDTFLRNYLKNRSYQKSVNDKSWAPRLIMFEENFLMKGIESQLILDTKRLT